MKTHFEIRNTYDEADDFAATCPKPMYILQGDDDKFWIVDLPDASKLIKRGYKIARKAEKTMEIIRKCPDQYTVRKNSENHFSLVKVLKDYGNDKAALEDLTRIVLGEITEQDLTGGSYEREVEAGKPGNRINVLEAALEGIRDKLVQAMGDSDRLEKAAREAVERINELVEG